MGNIVSKHTEGSVRAEEMSVNIQICQ